MLSVASLLNPVTSDSQGPEFVKVSLSPSHASTIQSSSRSNIPPMKRTKMSKDCALFVKGKPKGDVNFPPFDRLDEEGLRDMERFKISPLGAIWNYARHIPYNSEKKIFMDKTGRESFEVFQYVFCLPDEDREYQVFWDYNNGLVRLTPFFKCCKYSKTTPAKMLNANPGLKDITHSITGGSLAAQGYWMPYDCAREVCATFCHDIAPALIPIFGPTFPSDCIPPGSRDFERWSIKQSTIRSATIQSEAFRRHYTALAFESERSFTSSIKVAIRSSPMCDMNPATDRGRRLRIGRKYRELEKHHDPDIASLSSEAGGRHVRYTPPTPASAASQSPHRNWVPISHQEHNMLLHHMVDSKEKSSSKYYQQPQNDSSSQSHYSPSIMHVANPYLSAIPRSTNFLDMGMGVINSASQSPSNTSINSLTADRTNPGSSSRFHSLKRRFVDEEDAAYDAEGSSIDGASTKLSSYTNSEKEFELNARLASPSFASIGGLPTGSGASANTQEGLNDCEQNAAETLLQLSFRDRVVCEDRSGCESILDSPLKLLNNSMCAVTTPGSLSVGIATVAAKDQYCKKQKHRHHQSAV